MFVMLGISSYRGSLCWGSVPDILLFITLVGLSIFNYDWDFVVPGFPYTRVSLYRFSLYQGFVIPGIRYIGVSLYRGFVIPGFLYIGVLLYQGFVIPGFR